MITAKKLLLWLRTPVGVVAALVILMAVGAVGYWQYTQSTRLQSSERCTTGPVPKDVILTYHSSATTNEIEGAIKSVSGKIERHYPELRTYVINVPAGQEDQATSQLRTRQNITSANRNFTACPTSP